MLNMFRSFWGFFLTLLEKHTPLRFSKNSVEGIFNYHKLSDRLITSGQPTELQFERLRDAGFEAVVNLLPSDSENSLDNEEAILNALGFTYSYIPVDFKRPTDADFESFCAVIEALGDKKTLVHCAANMRVSAFFYRYRVQVLGEDKDTAAVDLAKLWKPFGVWKAFLGDSL